MDTGQIPESHAGITTWHACYVVHGLNALRDRMRDAVVSGGVHCLYPPLLPQILRTLQLGMQPGFVILTRLKSFSGSLSRVLMCLTQLSLKWRARQRLRNGRT